MADLKSLELQKLLNRIMEVEEKIYSFYGVELQSDGVECPKCATHKMGFFMGKEGHLKCKCKFCNFVGDVIDIARLKDKSLADLKYKDMLKVLVEQLNTETKEEKEKNEIYKIAKFSLDKEGIYINIGTEPNGTSYGINITRADGKSLLSYLYDDDFINIFNESFEKPFKKFNEFLEINNFKMLNDNTFLEICKMIKNDNIEDNKNQYFSGLNNFVKLFSMFIGLKLAKHLKTKKIIVNNDIYSRIDFEINLKDMKMKNENLISKLTFEMIDKKKNEELIRVAKLCDLSEFQMINVEIISTNTYKELENEIFILRKELESSEGTIENIDNLLNPAYLSLKYGILDVVSKEYTTITYNGKKYRLYFKLK